MTGLQNLIKDRSFLLPVPPDPVIEEPLVSLSAVQTLSGKTLSAPVLMSPAIADFTSATHSHKDAAGGGTLDTSAISSGTLPVARGGTGATTSTGSGSVVLGTSPTLTTPSISGGTITSDVGVSSGVKIGGVDLSEFTAATLGAMPPVGTIIPFYDFDSALKYDSKYWALCNGSTGVIIKGLDGSQTLPDLSNRYLVGFGTEGGKDIGTAAWATAAVGNDSHQINLSHSHTVDNHTHSLSGHTHSMEGHAHTTATHTHNLGNHTHSMTHTHKISSHTHTISTDGSHKHELIGKTFISSLSLSSAGTDFRIDDLKENGSHNHRGATESGGNGDTDASSSDATGGPSSNSTSSVSSGATSGPSVTNTGAPSTAGTGSASPGTDIRLSKLQSIQPRSVRVRFIMRIQ